MIEWEETVEHKRRVFLEANYGLNRRTATLDDLRKACESVGLECMTSEESEKRMRDALAAVDLANGHANEAEARAEKAEAERDKATRWGDTARAALKSAESRLGEINAFHDKVAEIVDAVHHQSMGPLISGTPDEVVAAVRDAVAERNDLRTKLAALAAPVEGEPTVEALQRMFAEAPPKHPKNVDEAMGGALAAIWRAGHAAGLAKRDETAVRIGKPLAFSGPGDAPRFSIEPRDLPRATDEELAGVFIEAREKPESSTLTGGLRAVANRVRREQCLVTRAVESGVGFSIVPNDRGRWYVTANMREQNCAPTFDALVLAEMLGEVGR
jgi:hypothetical protein